MAPSKIQEFDATEINSLIANINSRLGGGFQGAFFVEGSRLDDKNRQEQLRLLYELNKKLGMVLAEMDKKPIPTEEEPWTSKAPNKGNGKLISTIESVIAQEMADKLRDFDINLKRIDERCKKSEDSNAALSARNQCLEAKNRSLEQEMRKLKLQPTTDAITDVKLTACQDRITRLEQRQVTEGRMQVLESKVTGQGQVAGARLHALETKVALTDTSPAVEGRVQDLESRVEVAEDAHRWLENEVVFQTARMTNINEKLRDKLATLRRTVYDNGDICSKNDKDMQTDISILQDQGVEDYDRIQALEARQSERPRGDQATTRRIEDNFQRRGNYGYQ